MTHKIRVDHAGAVINGRTFICPGTVIDGRAKWRILCDCGQIFEEYPYNVRKYKKNSCNCRRKHKGSNSVHYKRWECMKSRCHNPNDPSYHRYGGRGITVCESWKSDFGAFLRDVGPGYKPGLTLGRIDGEKGYSPDNVRWSTPKEQAANTVSRGTWK